MTKAEAERLDVTDGYLPNGRRALWRVGVFDARDFHLAHPWLVIYKGRIYGCATELQARDVYHALLGVVVPMKEGGA